MRHESPQARFQRAHLRLGVCQGMNSQGSHQAHSAMQDSATIPCAINSGHAFEGRPVQSGDRKNDAACFLHRPADGLRLLIDLFPGPVPGAFHHDTKQPGLGT